MKTKLLLSAALLALTVTCFGQQDLTRDIWTQLTGDWKGEGSGQPGQGEGTFSFSYDLDRKIIVRKSHSEYPASENKPKIIHEDLMVVFFDTGENQSRAVYFDNEGHIINYTVSYADKSVTLTSINAPDTPAFRVTYTLLENDLVNTKFEMSRDGVNFATYIEGTSRKIK